MAVSLVAFGPVALAKADDNIVERQTDHRSDTRSWFPEIYRNPAMQWNRYEFSLNRLSATYANSSATLPQRLEYGDKTAVAGGHIDAFLRKKKVSLWGMAHYTNGQTRHIRYSETSDFDLLYPYVMADTIERTSGRWARKDAIRPSWNTERWTLAPKTSRVICR